MSDVKPAQRPAEELTRDEKPPEKQKGRPHPPATQPRPESTRPARDAPAQGQSAPSKAAADASTVAQALPAEERLAVLKTYKLYVGGEFVRSESGRTYAVHDETGATCAQICQGSRKDLRDAVVAARRAQPGWAARSAYNRGQILYRVAEMLEGRRGQFATELVRSAKSQPEAEAECVEAVERVIYYAGWADKFQQVFSSVNPVSSSHFSFSSLEPMGVVSLLAPQTSPLLGLVSVLLPVIVGGNTCVVLASPRAPLPAVTLAEVFHASDVPPGVVNLLTGHRRDLIAPMASHMDVNALVYSDADPEERQEMDEQGSLNLKRIVTHTCEDWQRGGFTPYWILDTQELKTTWHPIGE